MDEATLILTEEERLNAFGAIVRQQLEGLSIAVGMDEEQRATLARIEQRLCASEKVQILLVAQQTRIIKQLAQLVQLGCLNAPEPPPLAVDQAPAAEAATQVHDGR